MAGRPVAMVLYLQPLMVGQPPVGRLVVFVLPTPLAEHPFLVSSHATDDMLADKQRDIFVHVFVI
jgi:hypothetical protein